MNQITIEKASLQDLSHLQQIGRQTFFETFSASNSEENMRTYLDEGFSAEKLSAEVQDPNSAFYVARQGERVIGYLKLNTGPAQTELQDEQALEIERIYVLQEFHGQKVGQMLYEEAMRVATQMRAAYVWLGVWEENPRAIRFYQKNGFVEFDKHLFKLGDDEQTDILMKRPLTSPG
ncbi:GNAT family N-acetyltransferase [Hymenobacter swuensis]|uniref:Protease synthase and sporulation negative regulatory protein PAI 1 n=1 Tax=Hymenobacter swuensis DY53 TaxID=1227739 RepID=W8F6C9_9BACT|nr:GNAT family N-acetyltransferase [Hymenobacter swuensis]AHJ98181.1 protease synthase and sporulation negative regulatory protein PAI 1 [Hymenobacter swuensis DY53]